MVSFQLSVAGKCRSRLDWPRQKPDHEGGLNDDRSNIQMSKEPKFITDRKELEKLAPMLKAPIRRQVFVCNGKSCSQVGSAEVKAEFERILEAKGLRQGKEKKGRNPMGEILLNDCGSIGFCSIGVAVMVHPDGVLYGQVQAEDVEEIIEEHLVKGNAVRRLALMKLPNG